ncbi:MAG TPA: VTT domain-containing protein [Burkholderiales bacterium]|nr:VTT domain-containing protein [Burkholderiales bacterium]
MARASLLRLGLLVAFAAIIALAWLHRSVLDPARLQHQIQATGLWAPMAFIALFAMGTLVFLPGAVFGLAGGALFGPEWGTVWNLIGAALGAALAFLAARHFAGDWVSRRTGSRLKALIQGVEAEGWRFVAFVRLVPLFPFNLLNYALGLTRIRLDHYILASALAMLPGTIAYTWLGHAGREAAAGSDIAVRHLLLALGCLAVVAFLPRLLRRLRRTDAGWVDAGSLTRQLEQDRGPLVIDVRGAEEFNGPLGHIPVAKNIPLGDLPGRVATLVASKPRRLILVCRTDRRSASAAELLKQAGFADVSVLRGGMEEWNRQGLEIARDASR